MENDLGDLARLQNKEVYIVAGVAGNKGTVKNEGKIVIPAFTWKVAVVMPRDEGLANVTKAGDIEVIAAIMPNVAGIRNDDWNKYRTTVAAVQTLSGYDLLSLLPDAIEAEVEGDKPPVASTNGPFSGSEGTGIAMTGSTSSDPDNTPLTYAWSFGDGTTGTGPNAMHTYTQDGSYTVRLIVADPLGLADTITTTATVANVVPVVAAFAGASNLLPGETYSASGSFTDPGSDPWAATVDYGDGAGVTALTLSGKTFTLSHVYATPGTFTVSVRIADDDATSPARTATVTVISASQGVTNAIALVEQLGEEDRIHGNSLDSKLDNAQKWIDRGRPDAAAKKLQDVLDTLADLVRTGNLSASDAEPVRLLVQRILDSIS
jgi:PKD repeat protein